MDFAALLAVADDATQVHLGGPVTYTPGAGAPVDVRGIFDQAYVDAQSGDAEVSTSGPAVFLTLADLPTDPTADESATVTVNGVTYSPFLVKPDGLGGVRLRLHLKV